MGSGVKNLLASALDTGAVPHATEQLSLWAPQLQSSGIAASEPVCSKD